MVLNAVSRLIFVITAGMIGKAVRYEKAKCVVALALKDRKDIADVLIGASVSTVTFTSGRVVRYRTPTILRDALNRWDRTGDWELPPGTYYLEVPAKPKTKYVKHKTANVVTFYTSGRRRRAARNPRHIEFLRKRAA